MADRYFEKFQIISYANTAVVNLTQRAMVLNSVYNNPNLYYLYEIEQYERPDLLAEDYYQDPHSSWVLYLSNRVIDPYYDWNVDHDTFMNFIIKKYGTLDRATTKVKHYRNNWYNNQEQITVSAYNSLNQALKQYYEPVYLDDLKDTIPTAYKRRRIDWKYNTNSVARYAVANGSSFTSDEIVNITFDANNTGKGQVSFANSTFVVLQHLSGVTTTGTITGNSYLYGTESRANTVFTAANSVANNISSIETTYWSPVTYYEYENEINTNNRSIRIMDKKYAAQVSKELKKLLK